MNATSADRYLAVIAKTFAKWEADGKDLHPTWITHEICETYASALVADSEESDFWRHFTHKGLRQEVGQYARKKYGVTEDRDGSDQQSFPGFDHVQRHYIVEREGDEIAARTSTLTGAEIDAIVRRLRRHAKGCLAHADELDRYKHWRNAPQFAGMSAAAAAPV